MCRSSCNCSIVHTYNIRRITESYVYATRFPIVLKLDVANSKRLIIQDSEVTEMSPSVDIINMTNFNELGAQLETQEIEVN